MSFFSWYFLLFLAGALLLYYEIKKKLRWLILLAVSLCFYYLGGWRGLLYLLFTAATTYGAWTKGELQYIVTVRFVPPKSL